MIKHWFKSKVPTNTNKLTFNHITFITSIDEHGNIKIISFDCPFIKTNDKDVTFPSFWQSENFINSFKLSKLNDAEVNLVRTLIQKLLAYKKVTNIKVIFQNWLFSSTERFIQRKQIIELLLDKTVDYINQKKAFYEEIIKQPDIELKLSEEEYERIRKELFGRI